MDWVPFHCKRGLCQGLVVALWLRGLTWSGTETHPGGKKSAGGSVPASSADARKKWGAWGQCP